MDNKLYMTEKYRIIDAEVSHIKNLADNLRDSDRIECRAMGLRGFRAISRSLKTSFYAKTGICDDGVIAMFGVGGTLMGTGYPWILTSHLVERAPASFLRETKHYIEEMLNYYNKLSAMIHNDYEKALKFFSLFGFKLSEPKAVDASGELWREATLEGASYGDWYPRRGN